MPMTFTDEVVDRSLKDFGLDETGTAEEKRERYAIYSEEVHKDHLQVWEVRTGRPWNEMTPEEARSLVEEQPQMMRNPGVLSRLMA